MTEQYNYDPDPAPRYEAEPRVEDPAAMVKFETPTSHGMMWAISSPTGGVLALVRDEAAADIVLTALAAYVPPIADPESIVREAGWMSEEEIIRRTEEAQDNLRRAGQLCPLPPPVEPIERQPDLFAPRDEYRPNP